MTKREVAELVVILATAFQNWKPTEEVSALYERLLEDVDADAGKRAVLRLVATLKFPPTIAEIRSAAAELACGHRRLGAEAWGDVLEAIRRVGSYGAPRFADPITAECVRLMGWRNLCLSQQDAADRARFQELYDGLQSRARDDAAAGRYALPAPKQGGLARLPGRALRALPPVPDEPVALPPSREPATVRALPTSIRIVREQPETEADIEARRIDQLARLAEFETESASETG